MADPLGGAATYLAECRQCGYVAEQAVTDDINAAAYAHLQNCHVNAAGVVATKARVWIHSVNVVVSTDIPA